MIEKIYIGSYSSNIKVAEFNQGNLKIVGESEEICCPSYLCINHNMLYAVSETKIGGIGTFQIIGNKLKKIDFKEINQSLPCYIATKENQLLIASYEAGSIILYELDKKQIIQKECKSYFQANMHFADFVGNNIYAIDLGNDNIYLYNSQMQEIFTIELEKGSGPRHLAVSKDEKTIYVVTELSNQIYIYHRNKKGFELLQKISTLLDESSKSYAGAIKISKDNKNIYVTNRGNNTISVFSIKEERLTLIQDISSYGDFPRDIFLNESEEYLMVANQKSDNIVIYKRNLDTGILEKTQNGEVKVDKPSCIIRSSYEV